MNKLSSAESVIEMENRAWIEAENGSLNHQHSDSGFPNVTLRQENREEAIDSLASDAGIETPVETITFEELLEYFHDFHITENQNVYGRSPWNAVWVASVLFCASFIVYVVFMRTLNSSEMDRVFVNLFRAQATQCITDCLTTAFRFVADAYSEMPSLDVCRFLITVSITFKCSFKFSILLIGLTRVGYIVAPIYLHGFSKTEIQAALFSGWAVFFTLTSSIIYEYDIWYLPGFSYCLRLRNDEVQRTTFVWTTVVITDVSTVLVYIFILFKRFKSKVPIRQQQRKAKNRATLVTCMVQFGMQVIGFLPSLYFYIGITDGEGLTHFTANVLCIIANQSILTPIVLIWLIRRSHARRN